MEQNKIKKLKLNLQNWQNILVDILALQEFAKKFWGEDIMFPDDFGMSVLDWQYHLSRLVTSRNPKKEIKKYFSGKLQ